MVEKADIQNVFLLDNNPELFELAITPRELGGTSKFEQLALFGDKIIDLYLYQYLINKMD